MVDFDNDAGALTPKQSMDEVIDALIDAGVLQPVNPIELVVNSAGPYDVCIEFKAGIPVGHIEFRAPVRRLMESVELRLRRKLGFSAGDDVWLKNMKLIRGFMVVQQVGDSQLTVDMQINLSGMVGTNGLRLQKDDVIDALKRSRNLLYKNGPILVDKETIECVHLPEGIWRGRLFDPEPDVFSVSGRRLRLEME